MPAPAEPEVPPTPAEPATVGKLPTLDVTTAGGAAIASKNEYVEATFVWNDGEDHFSAPGKIRGRGNATWTYEKKPYRVKFEQKQSVCGFAADKVWVLLAEYCYKSLMRTTWMRGLSEAVGMPYTINCRHIELTVNGSYEGIYLICDHVEKASGRINIEDDGFIIEDDHYWAQEPLSFSSRQGFYTFKYPDADDEEITRVSESYYFIRDFVKGMEDALYSPGFSNPESGYRAWLDVDTFVKWYLVNELLGNYDPNFYYVLPTRQARLMMYPLWDFEWSLGLAGRAANGIGWASPPFVSPVDIEIWSREKYFARLFQDPYFVGEVRKQWSDLKPKLPDFKATMHSVAESISVAQEANFERWPILDQYIAVGLIALGSWEAEVDYLEDFFDRRVAWFDGFITNYTSGSTSD